MRKEHFDHVYTKYKSVLDRAHFDNLTYHQQFEEVVVSKLTIFGVPLGHHGWDIIGSGSYDICRHIFVRIPTLNEAEEILRYIKDTEVLFL